MLGYLTRERMSDVDGLSGSEFNVGPDGTSIIKTILLAFAKDPAPALAKMPPRVQRAPSLASVLGPVRTDIDDPRTARHLVDAWREEEARRRRAQALPRGRADRSRRMAPASRSS